MVDIATDTEHSLENRQNNATPSEQHNAGPVGHLAARLPALTCGKAAEYAANAAKRFGLGSPLVCVVRMGRL